MASKNDINGLPIKLSQVVICSGNSKILANEASEIRMMGNKMGMNASQADGSFLYSCDSVISSSSGIKIRFLAYLLANQVDKNKLGIDTMSPTMITKPMESEIFKLPAADKGPGVGGTSVWVAKSPPESPMAIVPSGILDFFATILLSFERIIKPESQKTGMPTKAPMTDMAKVGYFLPKESIIKSATFIAAPDLSKTAPITQPKITIRPILVMRSPKPLPMVSASLSMGSPAEMPTKRAAMSKPAKG